MADELVLTLVAERDCLRSTKTGAKSRVKVFTVLSCTCEAGVDIYLGLSLLFFILSLMGNLTYGAGVSDTASCTVDWTQANGVDIDSLPFYRERIFPHQSPMAYWIAGNYC